MNFYGTNPQDSPQNTHSLPLKGQEINAVINRTIATIDIIQIYYNNTQNPLEVTLEFPLEPDYALGKLTVQIGDNVVEGKVLKKEKAIEKYDDAVAGGNTAAMAKEKDDDSSTLEIKIGNLLPGQESNIHFQLLNALKLDCGAFSFKLPLTFFPSSEEQGQDYQYHFKIEIKADNPITYLSTLTDSKVVRNDSDKNIIIEKEGDQKKLKKDLTIYFKTSDMDTPLILCQESDKHPGEVACLLSITPTFLDKQKSATLETVEGLKPEPVELESFKQKNYFIFIVDRSGSMSGSKMETTKEALILFLKSLPPDSMFDIVSFGTNFEHMSKQGFTYNDKTVQDAISNLQLFGANFGGTNLYDPMNSCISSLSVPHGFVKKIFILTDGETDKKEGVIQLAKSCKQDINLHTFGIGHDCSIDTVSQIARYGRGFCSIVRDNKNLRAMVIQSLSRSQQPQYSNCKFHFDQPLNNATNSFNQQLTESFELFRYDYLYTYWLMKKSDFDKLRISMTSDKNELINKKIQLEMGNKDFVQLINGEELFKIAIKSKINEIVESSPSYRINDKEIIELSTKYQVLSKYTAYLAINKNETKSNEELKHVEIIREKIQKRKAYDVDLMDLCCSSPSISSQQNYSQSYGNQRIQTIGLECYSKPKMAMARAMPSKEKSGGGILSGIMGLFGSKKKQAAVPVQRSNYIQSEMMCECLADDFDAYAGNDKSLKGRVQRNDDLEERLQALKDNRGGAKKAVISRESSDEEEEKSKKKKKRKYKKAMSPKMQEKEKLESRPSASQMIQSQAQQVPKRIPKKLDDLLMGQSSSVGCWNSKQLILDFVDNIESPELMDQIKSILKDQSVFEQVWLTLVALYILNEKFGNREDEWQLIASKANKYLKLQGVDKVEIYLNQMNLSLY